MISNTHCIQVQKLHNFDRIIMGVDPGTQILGYSFIGIKKRKIHLINMGVVKLAHYENHFIRLKKIYDRLSNLIESFLPDELSIEAPFYGKNIQSMLKLGRAQGVAMLAALEKDIPVFEYVPMRIKQAVSGNGRASKEQVADMIVKLLDNTSELHSQYLDATDATAAAICHYFLSTKNGLPNAQGSTKTWNDFVKQNPNRIR